MNLITDEVRARAVAEARTSRARHLPGMTLDAVAEQLTIADLLRVATTTNNQE